jgi:hypothetical protein
MCSYIKWGPNTFFDLHSNGLLDLDLAKKEKRKHFKKNSGLDAFPATWKFALEWNAIFKKNLELVIKIFNFLMSKNLGPGFAFSKNAMADKLNADSE